MIQDYENSLRYIISHILGDADTTDFKVSPDRIEKWKEKREIEKKKYKGALDENRIIYYSDFYDLGTIVSKNWDKFKDVFHDKKRFEVLFHEIETFRDTISHSRDLMPYREHFLSFAVGDLKNKITIYHNKNMNRDDYFIRILKVSDSIGHIWVNPNPRENGFDTNSTIRVGGSLEFLVDAFDPKGRQILFELNCGQSKLQNSDGKFTMEITKEMVFPTVTSFHITASTEGSEYENKARISLFYTVLPIS